MTNETLDRWIWVLVYGGLLVLVLGLAAQRTDAAVGWTLVVAGGAGAALGALLLVLRSRRQP